MMKIEAWSLIAQAVQAGIILVGAFYLNHLVREQRALKDATVDTKNALIEHLKALSAPAMARDLSDLTSHAEKMAVENRELKEKNSKLSDVASKLPDLLYRQGFAQGLGEGRAALRLVLGAVTEDLREADQQGRPPIPTPRFIYNIFDYIKELTELSGKVLEGQKPEPAFGPRADELEKKLRFNQGPKTSE
jgi:hypothetical protein